MFFEYCQIIVSIKKNDLLYIVQSWKNIDKFWFIVDYKHES